jgi:nitrous oxidase accessory protein NosD
MKSSKIRDVLSFGFGIFATGIDRFILPSLKLDFQGGKSFLVWARGRYTSASQFRGRFFTGEVMHLVQPRKKCVRGSVARGVESLEGRQLMAAHIVGMPGSFATIQAAVNAASPGNTVRVDPGVYHESVVINKQLTVQGGGFFPTVVDGALVATNDRTTSFTISADDVTLAGFTIQNNNDLNHGAGIVISPGVSGTKILGNNINNNVTGLYLANDDATDPAIIRGNVFAFNNNSGQNNGRGIYTDGGVSGGLLTNVVIDQNVFVGNVGDGTSGNPEAAVDLHAATAGKQFDVSITNNVMVGNGKAVYMINAMGINICGNLITGCTDSSSAAVRDEGNVSNATITGNSFLFNSGSGIMIDQKFAASPSSNFTVTGNNFLGNQKGALVIAAGGYTGTLNATNNWWGSFFGPSSSGQDALITNGNSVTSSPFSRFPIL